MAIVVTPSVLAVSGPHGVAAWISWVGGLFTPIATGAISLLAYRFSRYRRLADAAARARQVFCRAVTLEGPNDVDRDGVTLSAVIQAAVDNESDAALQRVELTVGWTDRAREVIDDFDPVVEAWLGEVSLPYRVIKARTTSEPWLHAQPSITLRSWEDADRLRRRLWSSDADVPIEIAVEWTSSDRRRWRRVDDGEPTMVKHVAVRAPLANMPLGVVSISVLAGGAIASGVWLFVLAAR